MQRTEVSAQRAFDQLALCPEGAALWAIDVRSPGEYQRGSFPGTVNLPILDDEQRHEVGLTFKEKGQTAAIELGHQRVCREAVVARWAQAMQENPAAFVFCWRGGLRSQIATQWMREVGFTPTLVQGGYKALRREVLDTFEQPFSAINLSGLTGSGKTELLRELTHHVDLEGCANHRGSAFGGHTFTAQPSQQCFENRLGLRMRAIRPPYVFEDESRMIGSLTVPKNVFDEVQRSPLVFVEASLEERAERIYQEYLGQETDLERVRQRYLVAIQRISQRLGGLLATQLTEKMERAFALGDKNTHLEWIAVLLSEYYDPSYLKGFERKKHNLVFRGHRQACLEFLTEETGRSMYRSVLALPNAEPASWV